MRLNGKARRSGAVRIEYIIAGVICIALLAGMTAVLVRFSRLEDVSRPSSVTIRPAETQTPEREQPSHGPEARRETPQPEPTRIESPARIDSNAETRAPGVVVTEVRTETTRAPSIKPAGGSIAYPSGEARIISSTGRTRIEAENYDLGGEGVAYHDMSSENTGGAYRPNERVDISICKDETGDTAVSYIRPGEWLNYTISVSRSGAYRLQIRAARKEPGSGRIRFYFNGVDKTGEVAVPNTREYEQFATTDAGVVELAAGEQVMRVEMITGDINLNWIEISPTTSSPSVASVSSSVKVQAIDISPPSNSPPQSPTVQSPAASMSLNTISQEEFEEIKIGQRPTGQWDFSGSVTVQQAPGESQKCLRLVDISRAGECLVGQQFPEQKEMVVLNLRVRFNATASEFGFSLVEDKKQAIFIYTTDDQIGYADDGGNWHSLVKYEANTWYDLRIEANVKERTFRLIVNNVQAGDSKLKFRNWVGKVNGWIAGTSPSLTGTMYIDNMKVEGR